MSDMMPSRLDRVQFKQLDKGMKATIPTTLVPVGAFLDIKDMYVTPNGLQRRNAWRLYFQAKAGFGRIPINVGDGEVVTDMEGFFDVNNKLQLLAFTNKRLYVNSIGDGFVPVPFGRQSYAVTAQGADSVTCAGATFVTDRIWTGDSVILTDTVGVETEVEVVTIDSETELTLSSMPAGTIASIVISRNFVLDEGEIVDYTFIPKGIVIVDGSSRGVWKYESPDTGVIATSGPVMVDMNVHGSADDIAAGDGNYLKGAKTCHFFNGYLMLGNVNEVYSDAETNSKLDQKRTVRWSSVTDISEFAIIDYVMFTMEMSEVVKITSSEECPVVFLSNGIYFGTPSDLAGLPYKYARVETGAISAVGKRAMCSVPGGMVFIAQKNIYYMELARQGTRVPVLTPIGNDIYTKANYENNGPKSSRAVFSPQQNMLMCSFPKRKMRLGRIFCFSFETKAWSYIEDDSSRFTCANVFPYYILLKWSDGGTQDWSDYDEFTWFSLKLEDYTSRVFVTDVEGYFYVSDDSYNWDETTDGNTISQVPYQCVVESGDIDFGSPGVYKVMNQMIVTLADVATRERTTDISMTLAISTDRGKTWTDKADILFEADSFLEDVHFRSASEVVRFRLTFGSNSALFTLAELETRFRLMGAYVQRGP